MAETYDIGDDVFLRATFKDTDDALADPTTVACRVVRTDDGTVVTLTPSKTSTGLYVATFQPTQHGQHIYRYEGVGALRTAGEGVFLVRPQRVP